MIDWDYWVNKAKEFRDVGKYEEAIDCYEKILEYYPRDSYALTMMGSCYSDLKQFNKAIIYVDKALDVNPMESFNWFNKAIVYFDNENYDEALKYFDKSLSLKGDDYVSWYFKGWCYYYLGDISKAIECFEISYNMDHDEDTMDIINDLKKQVPDTKICPSCGVVLRKNKKVCPKCNYNFKKSKIDKPTTSKKCPNCGRMLSDSAINCGFCGYSFSSGSIGGNKKVSSKSNNNSKSRINKPISVKHFDNGIVSFDYTDNYSKDFNSKYEKIGVIASFKIGSSYNFDSAFAIFEGDPILNKIPDSKFKEVIEKSMDLDVLDINRYVHKEKERIIIKTLNNTNDNIEYRCNVPEIGFSVLFVIPGEKEYLFDEKCISTVVDSLEKSTGKSIPEKEISKADDSLGKSSGKSIPKKESKICSNCGYENPNDSNFCMECGMKLDISNDVNFCIYCGTEVVPGAKFCMNCGKLIEY